MFVLDASVTITWLFTNQSTPYSESVLSYLKQNQAVVPPLWHLEITNVVLGAERKQHLTHSQCLTYLEFLGSLNIVTRDSDNSKSSLFTFAVHHKLSAYDATYLELAIKLGLPLATLNNKIRQAAEQAGVKRFEIS
jgi:predicted nucleic acid-binding protein